MVHFDSLDAHARSIPYLGKCASYREFDISSNTNKFNEGVARSID